MPAEGVFVLLLKGFVFLPMMLLLLREVGNAVEILKEILVMVPLILAQVRVLRMESLIRVEQLRL